MKRIIDVIALLALLASTFLFTACPSMPPKENDRDLPSFANEVDSLSLSGKDTSLRNDRVGLEWQVGLGIGFDRKMIARCDVGKLAVKEGRISVSICVDRSGKVIRTKYNPLGSSLREPDLIRKAEECAAMYVFASDPSAPVEQCGTLTFIFKNKS